jgi:hypothetical protein
MGGVCDRTQETSSAMKQCFMHCRNSVATWFRTVNNNWLINELHGAESLKSFLYSHIFYGTPMFITVFTRARHRSPSILILYFHLHLGLPSDFLPSSFATNIFLRTSHPPVRATCPVHPWFDHPISIWWIMNLFIAQLSPTSRHFTPLGPNILLTPCFQTPSVCALPLTWETKFHNLAK